jgi:hypothetical protein
VIRRALCLAAAGTALGGCVSTTTVDSYPADWPQAAPAEKGVCPRIAGRYRDAGTQSGSHPYKVTQVHRYKNWWDNDTHLIANIYPAAPELSSLEYEAEAVVIEQPDPDTLRVSLPDRAGFALAFAPKTFKRSGGDFDCVDGALTISSWGATRSTEGRSAAGNAAVSSLALLTLSAGMAHISRSFRPLGDGSLAMEYRSSGGSWILLFGVSGSEHGYVRWQADREATP